MPQAGRHGYSLSQANDQQGSESDGFLDEYLSLFVLVRGATRRIINATFDADSVLFASDLLTCR